MQTLETPVEKSTSIVDCDIHNTLPSRDVKYLPSRFHREFERSTSFRSSRRTTPDRCTTGPGGRTPVRPRVDSPARTWTSCASSCSTRGT